MEEQEFGAVGDRNNNNHCSKSTTPIIIIIIIILIDTKINHAAPHM